MALHAKASIQSLHLSLILRLETIVAGIESFAKRWLWQAGCQRRELIPCTSA